MDLILTKKKSVCISPILQYSSSFVCNGAPEKSTDPSIDRKTIPLKFLWYGESNNCIKFVQRNSWIQYERDGVSTFFSSLQKNANKTKLWVNSTPAVANKQPPQFLEFSLYHPQNLYLRSNWSAGGCSNSNIAKLLIPPHSALITIYKSVHKAYWEREKEGGRESKQPSTVTPLFLQYQKQ